MSESLSAPPPVQDRTAGLVAFGVFELLLGGCCSLMFPFSLLGLIAGSSVPASQPPPPMGALVTGSLFYAGLGAFFITMGIGSIRARRWARTLMLVFSCIWLVTGVMSSVTVLLMLPVLREGILATAGAGDPAILNTVLGVTAVIVLVVYLLLPGAFLLFYRSPHVKATCERKDPKVPWTDRCPAPLLAASLVTGFGGLALVALALGYRVIFFFGLVRGVPAILLGLAFGGLQIFGALELYRQRRRGWWLLMGIAALFVVSSVVFLFHFDLVALYEAMGYSLPWAKQMMGYGAAMRWAVVAWAPLWLAFLVWVKRYLQPPA